VTRVLVTGGTGFLGSHLVSNLIHAGCDVRALDVNPPEDGGEGGAEFIQGDVRDRRILDRALAGCDVVVDNAALVPVTRASDEEFRSVNVEGCRTTLEAARDAGAYVLHISSSAIYGIPVELPVTERTPFAPFEPYGRSKAEADRLVARERASGLPAASLRPRTLIGPGRMGLFDLIFRRVEEGKSVPLFGSGQNRVQMCDVQDFCTACLAAIERRAETDFNIGATSFGTARGDIEALIDHAGTGARVLPVPAAALSLSLALLERLGASPFTRWHWRSAPTAFYFDTAKAREELGWGPKRSNAEALCAAYDHWLEHRNTTGASVHRRPLSGVFGGGPG
jgi:nucleoside-diphosphate-sugar epimerase